MISLTDKFQSLSLNNNAYLLPGTPHKFIKYLKEFRSGWFLHRVVTQAGRMPLGIGIHENPSLGWVDRDLLLKNAAKSTPAPSGALRFGIAGSRGFLPPELPTAAPPGRILLWAPRESSCFTRGGSPEVEEGPRLNLHDSPDGPTRSSEKVSNAQAMSLDNHARRIEINDWVKRAAWGQRLEPRAKKPLFPE